MFGWREALAPDIRLPLSYSGDALSSTWLTQRAMEGWIFNNDRSGFPFGSSFLDYPGSDSASFLILKLLGLLTGSSAAAVNLYFLIGFPVNFLAAFYVLRSISVGRAVGFAAAILFAFAPFHFLRLPHLFYTWYFVVPVYFFIGLQIALGGPQLDFAKASWPRRTVCTLGFLVLSSFGVYFTAFGMVVIAAASAVAMFNRKFDSVRFIAAPAIFFLAVGTALNIAPNVINEHRHGHNPEVAARNPVESEIYATKPIQLILPRPGHRSAYLSAMSDRYNSTTPLVNENSTAALGMFGTIGLIILLLAALKGMAGARTEPRISVLASASVVLIGFMVVGGLGSLFAHLISPSIRGWNRASIFLSFSTIAAFALVAQALNDSVSRRLGMQFASTIALLMLTLGLWDQTAPVCSSCRAETEQAYTQDRTFIDQMERALPPGAAVYQLPYMTFPESPPINNLQSYDLAVGFIHSQNLKWSFGGIRGRQGDLFFRNLATLPVPEQLEIVKNMGFNAVYIDTRGYPDGGSEVVQAWSAALGREPSLQRRDGKVVMFALEGSQRRNSRASAQAYAPQLIGRKALLPSQLRPLLGTGWSVDEPWGVWSQGSASTLRISAPPKEVGRTQLTLYFNAFVPGTHELTVTARIEDGQPVTKVVTADQAQGLIMEIPLPPEPHAEVLNVTLSYNKPISPKDAGVSSDARELAIGLTSLQWTGQ
jgi:phosphoglycerol transferase